jgi:hypothetical protein
MADGKENFQHDSTDLYGFNIVSERYVESAETAIKFEYLRIKINAINESIA